MSRKWVLPLALMLISSMFFVLIPVRSVATEPVRVYVDPPTVIDPDALFNVSVKVDNLVDLAGAEFILTWDPTLLRAVNMTEIMFHEVTPQSEWDNIWQIGHTIDLGRVRYGYLWSDLNRASAGGYAPISGNHTMAIITFQVLGVGNCPLSFIRDWTILADSDTEPIAHDVTDSYFSNSVLPLPPLPIEPPRVRIYVDPRRVKNESLTVNETFTVEVKMDSLTNHSGIIGLDDFSLSWDPTLLDCTKLTINQLWHGNQRMGTFVYNDCGECMFFIYPPIGPPQTVFGNLTLATITFAVKGTGSCRIHLQYCWVEEASAPGVQMLYSHVDGYFADTLNGDLNGDNRVGLLDAISFAGSFGVFPGYPHWNEWADMNGDGKVDILDAIALCLHFGQTG